MDKKMNVKSRKTTVLAMEWLARCINDEEIFMNWLSNGVADGDIPQGSLNIDDVDDYYIEDDNLAELMGLFLRLMASAKKDGGLYDDRIVSKD